MNSSAANNNPPTQPQQFLFDPNVAQQLEGLELSGGWKVLRKARSGPKDPNETGGCFSVGYIAEREGKQAFVKVFDLSGAFQSQPGNIMAALAHVVNNHQYESSLLAICEQAKLDRIVRVLEHGQALVSSNGGPPTPVPFIVFELADSDMRKAVARTKAIDDAWRFRILHQVAVGLQQLHGVAIAHQDLKPSNVLVFEKEHGAKIGDLGRASRNDGRIAAHDANVIAGAVSYAPPEQAYGVVAPEWRDRREGCDLYHLGSLMCFLFTGTTPNQAYMALPDVLRPPRWHGTWTGTYEMASPHISAAFASYLAQIRADLPPWAAEEMLVMIEQLCTPEYEKRGAPEARALKYAPLGLNRFISRLDRLALTARVKVRDAG